MSKESNVGSKKMLNKERFKNMVFYTASFLMPSILLFDLYNRNHADNHIVFVHVLILAGGLAVGGLMLFAIVNFLVKSLEGALIIVLFSWLIFWLYERLLGMVRGFFHWIFLPSRVFALSLLIVIILLIVIFRKYNPPLGKVRPAFNVLAACLIIMFLVNFIPGINHEVTITRARYQMVNRENNDEDAFYIKRSFAIDSSLPTPDIYWVHLDGLMSFETVEDFWGICHEYYREEFRRRGFTIYEDALLDAGFTISAFAMLFNPAFYDSFLGDIYIDTNMMLRGERTRVFVDGLAEVGLVYREDVAPYNELFSAFFARGYEFNITPLTHRCSLPTSFEHLTDDYSQHQVILSRWDLGDLPTLLSLTTPFNFSFLEGIDTDTSYYGSEREGAPRFTLNPINNAHMMSIHRRDNPDHDSDMGFTRYYLYPEGFLFALHRALNYIDVIIERNPNAVIIAQSDHGFHLGCTQEHLLEQGYSLEQVLELSLSVFSATRIPPEYGGGEEPIAPLNISRELVNRFVGFNYQLITGE